MRHGDGKRAGPAESVAGQGESEEAVRRPPLRSGPFDPLALRPADLCFLTRRTVRGRVRTCPVENSRKTAKTRRARHRTGRRLPRDPRGPPLPERERSPSAVPSTSHTFLRGPAWGPATPPAFAPSAARFGLLVTACVLAA